VKPSRKSGEILGQKGGKKQQLLPTKTGRKTEASAAVVPTSYIRTSSYDCWKKYYQTA